MFQSILLAIGNPTTIGEAFNISGPSPFAYDALANYVAEKLDLPLLFYLPNSLTLREA